MSFLSSAHRIQGRLGRAVEICKLWQELSWHSSLLIHAKSSVGGGAAQSGLLSAGLCVSTPGVCMAGKEAHPVFILFFRF